MDANPRKTNSSLAMDRRTFLRRSLLASASLLSASALNLQFPSTSAHGQVLAASPAQQTVPAKARLALSNTVSALDPAPPQRVPDHQITMLTTGRLYRFDLDKQPVPDLVDKSEMTADGKTITMTLKPNLVYSDGSPVKAGDAVYALERQRKGQGASQLTQIESATAPDDRTIVWSLKGPMPYFNATLAMQYLLLHPKDKVQADKDYFNHPVSAGPYMLKDYVPGSPTCSLVINPNYSGAKPAIQQLDFVSVPDLTSRVLQLATGAMDWAYDLPFSSGPNLPKEVTWQVHPVGGIYHLIFNLKKQGPWQDKLVRQAMSLAIDRDQVNKLAFSGAAPASTAVLFNGALEYAPSLPNGGKRDLEGAKKLLAQTQYANGFDFSLLAWSARPGWKEAALIIAQNLKDLKINATVEPVEDAVVFSRVPAGQFDVSWLSTVQAVSINIYSQLYIPGGAWADPSGYSNPALVDILNKAAIELDLEKRKQLVASAEKIMVDDMPHIPVCERAVLAGSRLGDLIQLVNAAEWPIVKSAS